ncbi:hypothetical protein F5Y04DRAFT_16781 [Hypomontagnella monticulosa]|nr:hypothetical protein F5Y04DRAFT_16781 [Hypomontagnella monticulosa]
MSAVWHETVDVLLLPLSFTLRWTHLCPAPQSNTGLSDRTRNSYFGKRTDLSGMSRTTAFDYMSMEHCAGRQYVVESYTGHRSMHTDYGGIAFYNSQ